MTPISGKTEGVQTLPIWILLVAGLASLNAGVVMFLCAVDIIPTPDSKFGAPRWIIALIAVLPFSVGVMLTSELFARLLPAWRKGAESVTRIAMLLIVVTFLHAAGSFLTWAAITGAEGQSSLTVLGFPVPWIGSLVHIVDRVLIAIVALIVDAMIVFVWIVAAARLLGRRA